MFDRIVVLISVLLVGCCRVGLLRGLPGDHEAMSWHVPYHALERERIIDCGGKTIDLITVSSSWTTIKHCIVDGGVVIRPATMSETMLVERSRRRGYVGWIRSLAPAHVVVKDSVIVAKDDTPLQVLNGSWDVRIENVVLKGRSDGPMVYVGPEASRVVIRDSIIDARHSQTAIDIDSSDHNLIERNVIVLGSDGGVFLYRNCGVGGRIRHTTPSYNQIIDNVFKNGGNTRPAVFLGSREGAGCHCSDDKGFPFGSSQSDLDHSRLNFVKGNVLGGSPVLAHDRHTNTVSNNQ